VAFQEMPSVFIREIWDGDGLSMHGGAIFHG